MTPALLTNLEASRARTASKLEQLDLERERLLGRLEGIDLSIATVRAHLESEPERLPPAVLEVGELFDTLGLEEDELAQVIPFSAAQTLSDGRKLSRGRESGESLDELTGAFSRQDGPLSSPRSGPRSRKKKKRRAR